MEAAIIEQAAVPHEGHVRRLVIHEEGLVEKLGLLHRELDLVEDERLLHIFFQNLKHHRRYVAHAEMADLAGALQRIEGLGHLLRIVEKVRTVQKKHVKIIRLKALETLVHARHDLLVGPVEDLAVRADPTLGLDDHILSLKSGHGKCVPEAPLGLPGSVDVCVVKEVYAELICAADKVSGGFRVKGGHTHAALDDGGDFSGSVCDINKFHRAPPLF